LVVHNYPLVSIIIVNFNGEDYLAHCLSSVLNTNYQNFEVILVDNASTDSSLEIAQKFKGDPRFKIIENKVNTGFSGGNNLGFGYSRGNYVVFLNNDTIVNDDWLSYLVEALQNDDTIGLAQSMILTIDGKMIQTGGWLFSDYLITKLMIGEKKHSNVDFQPIFEISFVCGASMVIKRDLIKEIGLFDSSVPFYYDDTLLSLKTWLADKKVVTVSKSKIRHIGGASRAWNVELITYNLLKANTRLIFDIYYQLDELAIALLLNVISTTINALFCLKRKNIAVIYANTRGFLWALKNLRYLWQNRLVHWRNTKITPKKLKENFIRIKIPIPFYIIPSKLTNAYIDFELSKYENSLLHGN
jgi:GT2 family glycosyltransferase